MNEAPLIVAGLGSVALTISDHLSTKKIPHHVVLLKDTSSVEEALFNSSFCVTHSGSLDNLVALSILITSLSPSEVAFCGYFVLPNNAKLPKKMVEFGAKPGRSFDGLLTYMNQVHGLEVVPAVTLAEELKTDWKLNAGTVKPSAQLIDRLFTAFGTFNQGGYPKICQLADEAGILDMQAQQNSARNHIQTLDDFLSSKRGEFKKSDQVFVGRLLPRGADQRIIAPQIGTKTIELCQKAGIVGIVVNAEASIIANKRSTLRFADKEGISIYGI